MAESATTPANAAEAGGKKFFSKGKILGFIGAIVVLQCVLAYLYLPGGDSAAKAESKKEAASRSEDKDHEKDAGGDTHAENREIDLGKFSLTAFDPNSNTTLLIDFHLYGTVAVDASEKNSKEAGENGHAGKGGKGGEGAEEDNTNFGRLFKKNVHRFRDQVIVIIRNATMQDLADPSLGLIKRQILAKTNSLLGEPLLKEVVFSDFAVVQQ